LIFGFVDQVASSDILERGFCAAGSSPMARCAGTNLHGFIDVDDSKRTVVRKSISLGWIQMHRQSAVEHPLEPTSSERTTFLC
jgi:hypothetical protein